MVSGGEGEIRTLGTSFPVHSLSRLKWSFLKIWKEAKKAFIQGLFKIYKNLNYHQKSYFSK